MSDHHTPTIPPEPLRPSSREPGEPPGTLEDIPEVEPSILDVIAYGPSEYHREQLENPEPIDDLLEQWPVVWVNVDGVGDASLLRRIGDVFGFHDLMLEDLQNYPQQPKRDSFDNRLYLIALEPSRSDGTLAFEHIGIFAGEGFVVTFQQSPGDSFDPIRTRIQEGVGNLRRVSADYLAYALLDTIVDRFFPLLEEYAGTISQIETDVVESRAREVISDIHATKSELFAIERASRPQRDMIASVVRNPAGVVSESTLPYYRDCYDHASQITETANNYRQMAESLLDLQLSFASHRMNEVMQVLSIIGSIFLPLTFIAGVYGMNFNPQVSPWNMPELHWAYGYPAVLTLMAAISLGLLWYFRGKGLLGGDRKPR